MGLLTHMLAAAIGGTVAIGGYAVVKVGADAERREDRRREVSRLLSELARELVAKGRDYPAGRIARLLDECTEKIMEVA